jgi:hypothetical protein
MTDKTDELRDIFLDVSDTETVTERQVEGASKAPVEGDDADAIRSVAEDGLDDAVDGAEVGVDAATG